MRIYFAGADSNKKYTDVLLKYGVKNRLESYFSLGNKQPSQLQNYLLDSGGFVARTKGITIKVEHYANFINRHNLRYVFNLDTNDIPQTLNNQQYLETNTNAYVIPIYHHSDYKNKQYRQLLDDYILKYKFIALGGIAGVNNNKNSMLNYLDYCFGKTQDRVRIHGLGMTAKNLLERYPYYSVDSTSWLSFARFGNSRANSKMMTIAKAKQRHYLDNTEEEITHTLKLEQYITKLWESRGVKWED